MAFHHTPRDGDYAAHLDRLVNQDSSSPGQVLATKRLKTERGRPDVSSNKAVTSAETAADNDDTPDVQLPPRPRPGIILIRCIIAVFLLIKACRVILDAVEYGADAESFLPAAFLAGIAIIILWLTVRRLPGIGLHRARRS